MGAKLPSSAKRRSAPTPDINVTPLVDVVLVLLIIFMVVTPAINDGEHIELPEITKVDKKKPEMDPIDLTLANGGVTLLDKERVSAGELLQKLIALHEAVPDRKIMINADVNLPYKRVRETFAALRDIGFSGMQLKVIQRKQETGA
jgi:biopolymer transport protein ExbD